MVTLQHKEPRPPRILIYGEPKKGKSTFGSLAPSPIFLQTEDGLDAIDIPAFPLAETFAQVLKYMEELANEEHDYKTLVVDSADWLEKIIHNEVAKEAGAKSIADMSYGIGYSRALEYWKEFIEACNWLRDNKDMMIIIIAHSNIADYKSPDAEAYSKHLIKLHKGAAAYLKERSDIILFVDTYVALKTEEGKFSSKRKMAIDTGERVLYTHDKNSCEAGSRFDMPKEIPFDKEGNYWSVIAQHIPYFKQQFSKE